MGALKGRVARTLLSRPPSAGPPPLRGTAQNVALFFSLLPPIIPFVLPSLCVFSLNFGGVFEGLANRVKPQRPDQTGPPEKEGNTN